MSDIFLLLCFFLSLQYSFFSLFFMSLHKLFSFLRYSNFRFLFHNVVIKILFQVLNFTSSNAKAWNKKYNVVMTYGLFVQYYEEINLKHLTKDMAWKLVPGPLLYLLEGVSVIGNLRKSTCGFWHILIVLLLHI